jgi:hypothetical protein
MTKTTLSATTSHAMPVKAKTSKLVVKNKNLAYWRRAPHDSIEAIKSGVRLDSNNGVIDLVESRIKSGVHLDGIDSDDGIINLIVPVNHDY